MTRESLTVECCFFINGIKKKKIVILDTLRSDTRLCESCCPRITHFIRETQA